MVTKTMTMMANILELIQKFESTDPGGTSISSRINKKIFTYRHIVVKLQNSKGK